MRKLLIGLVCMIMMATLCSFFSSIFGSSMSPKRKIAYTITNGLSKKLKSQYGLNFMGISEEAVDGKYKRIGIELNYNKILTKEQGRILLLNCAQDVLEAFNSCPKFEQYMTNFPFTNDNIIINIYIQPPHVADVFDPDIGFFTFYNGTLRYKTYSPEVRYQTYSTEMESFEEAKMIVEAQMNSYPK